jgi:DNA invertase Pin-like site-specific DNA recombinase
MNIGYARVSTPEQELQLQEDALIAANCKKIYTDTISGVTTKRPGLDQALSYAREGDTIIVWRLDRLGRSVQHLIQTVKDLEERNIGFRSLQENIDTTTSGGKLVFHIFGALAEFERDLIKERTMAGLKAARARGRHGGRPQLLTEQQIKRALELYKEGNSTISEICKIYKISSKSFYNYVKKASMLNDSKYRM